MTQPGSNEAAQYARRHLLFGWWSLLGFMTLGIALESLHGFKAGFYLDVANETRRLMWRLGHAHGGLLGLVHIAFAATVFLAPQLAARPRRVASLCLIAASVLLPGGFLLGGVVVYGGDPSPAVLLSPLGGAAAFAAAFLTAWSLASAKPAES